MPGVGGRGEVRPAPQRRAPLRAAAEKAAHTSGTGTGTGAVAADDLGPAALETLERCRRTVAPALREVVERLHPNVRRMVSFAFGWCDADGVPQASGGGKGLRPALTLLAAEAVGGSAEDAIPGAVAVELVHAFSLVHDDIMDGDERRRHRETLWKAFGTGPAVLAGDALLAMALTTLCTTADPGTGASAAAMLSSALIELVEGQAADLAFEHRPWSGPRAVTVEEYTAMAAHKTGSLLACAAGLGPLLGGVPQATAAMSLAGSHLGLGFQAVDDLLGIWGDPVVTGKPVHSDLRRRKKTLPVVFAAAADQGARAATLARLLDAPGTGTGNAAGTGTGRGSREVREAADLIRAAGGRAYTADRADRHLASALEIIDAVAVNPTAAAELTQLARFIAARSH